MEATVDHGVFEQAIITKKFDPELIPFLRISDLNDRVVLNVFGTIHRVATPPEKQVIREAAMNPERQAELSDHIFENLSNENVHELLKRSKSSYGDSDGGLNGNFWVTIIPHIRDHGVFNEAIDSLFGSAKTNEELYSSQMMSGRVLERLRFAELNNQVIDKIRSAAFHDPGSHKTMKISKENIEELIRRPGGLSAIDEANLENSERNSSVLTTFLHNELLTEGAMKYILSERPDLLNSVIPELLGRIPKDILTDLVFGNKRLELSEDTFREALGFILEVKNRQYNRGKYVSLSIDQIESLIENPSIISSQEFVEIEIKNRGELSHVKEIYKNSVKPGGEEAAPKGYRDKHLYLLKKRLISILEATVGLELDKGYSFHILLDGEDSVSTRFLGNIYSSGLKIEVVVQVSPSL